MMNSLLPEEKTTLQTYNKVAGIWVAKHNSENLWVVELKRFHEFIPKGVILEIGFGGGRSVGPLLACGYQYVGADISEELVKIVRKKFPKQKFYKQSVYELSFPKKFDGFWCAAVLLHVPKTRIDEALQRIKSVLKPGAIGFISIKDGQGEKVETELWEDHKTQKRFFSYWSKAEFIKALNRDQFTVVDYIYRPDSEKTRWHCFFVKLSKG